MHIKWKIGQFGAAAPMMRCAFCEANRTRIPHCCKIAITLKIPRLGNPSVSDRWSLAKIVRKPHVRSKHNRLSLVVAEPQQKSF